MSYDIYGECPCCKGEVFWKNISSNLHRMWKAAGVEFADWDGRALDDCLRLEMRAAVKAMAERPRWFRRYDAPNGWGTYDQFLPWMRELLEQLERAPDGTQLRVSP